MAPNTNPGAGSGAPKPRDRDATDEPQAPSDGQEPGTETQFTVSLERTACFGACPIYMVQVDDQGRVAWKGDRFVATTGVAEARLEADQVAELRAAIQNADFFELEDCYCERRVTDMPSVIVTLSWGDQKKTVRHYTGDQSAPERLIALQKSIDAILGTEQWIGKAPAR